MQGKRGGAQQISRAYDALLLSVIDLLETGRQIAARSVNALLTMTYWQVGQRLVEHEQGGAERADYGSGLLKRLSRDLQARLGRGFSERNLEQMRQFYLQWLISQTLFASSDQVTPIQISQTASAKLATGVQYQPFPLSWSHYVWLIPIADAEARHYYETEALRGGWSVWQLDRLCRD
jgi:hypothetical protein